MDSRHTDISKEFLLLLSVKEGGEVKKKNENIHGIKTLAGA